MYRYSSLHPQTGRLVARSDDSLVVQWLNGSREALPMFEVGGIDVSGGRRRYLLRGPLYGLLVGTAAGLLFRKLDQDELPDGLRPNPNLVPVSMTSGLVLGALVGSFGAERWYSTSRPSTRVGLVRPVGSSAIGIGFSRRI